jgi:hypothetical protein
LDLGGYPLARAATAISAALKMNPGATPIQIIAEPDKVRAAQEAGASRIGSSEGGDCKNITLMIRT